MSDWEQPAKGHDLSDEERARIRAEMRYAIIAAREAQRPLEQPGRMAQALAFLSNGFVLLLIGSLITSFLVPSFQRAYESRRQQNELMQQALSQFLLYSNSLWQEYYSILPATQQSELSKEEYLGYLRGIAEVKLKRYDAYAKVEALAIVFHAPRRGTAFLSQRAGEQGDEENSVPAALRRYAIALNRASAAIDRWLRELYCTPTNRPASPCASFDAAFDPFGEYERIKELVVQIGNQETENVAGLMVKAINEID